MSKLNQIQSEIRQLEGGKFQKLCDSYLYIKRNFENIQSLGSNEGSDKTTIGIPDTYIYNEISKKYILVMYSTRKDSKNKLLTDIEDAIKKTKMSNESIEEIICCHTNSNIKVDQDKSLRELAGSIKLTLIGIDTLAQDLMKFKYQNILLDFLNIRKSTEQVWGLEKFIELHDNSKTNAQLTTKYIDNQQLVNKMIEKLNDNQILIISGNPGVGKTKLAVEILKELDNLYNIIAVKSNSLSAYEDIKDALIEDKINYLFLDDANTIYKLNTITSLLQLNELKNNLKIIITVRDYALPLIKNDIMHFTTYHHKIGIMDNKNIEELIKSIANPNLEQLNRIIEMSKNNPRIGVLAANLVNTNEIDFSLSNKEIIDIYYQKVLDDNCLTNEEKISLFILSFISTIDFTRIKTKEKLLSFFEIDETTFRKSINKLHDKELCDIYSNMAAKISDQSLADFIILDFIANKKIVNLRNLFKNLYPSYQNEIINALNIINSFIYSKEWFEYIKNEIEIVYNDIILEKYKKEFLTQYGILIPGKVISYVNKNINKVEEKEFKTNQIEFEKKKLSHSVKDSYVKMLYTLYQNEINQDSIALLLKYFKKNQKLIFDVFLTIKENFNIVMNSENYLNKRFTIVDIFLYEKEINYNYALLMVNICEEFLKFSSECISFDGKNGIYKKYQLVDSQLIIDLHRKIFKLLSSIYKLEYEDVNLFIDKLILNYPIHKVKDGFNKTVKEDLITIDKLYFSDLKNCDKRKEIILFKLILNSKKYSIGISNWENYQPMKQQIIYDVFSSDEISYMKKDEEFEYEKMIKRKITALKNIYIDNKGSISYLINLLNEYQVDELLKSDRIEHNIYLLYDNLNLKDKKLLLKSLISNNFILSIYSTSFFMKELSYSDGRKMLSSIDKLIDKRWYIANLVECKRISDEKLNELLLLCENEVELLNNFNILSFEKFIKKDESVFWKFLDLYERKKLKVNFFIPKIISEKNAKKIVNLIDAITLSSLYIDVLISGNNDMSGELFFQIALHNDANFIIQLLENFNDRNLNTINFNFNNILYKIWELPYIDDFINKFIDLLLDQNKNTFLLLNRCLETILKENLSESFNIMMRRIINTSDNKALIYIFNLSLNIYNDEQLLNFFQLLKNKEIEDDFFLHLHLTIRTKSWSGSLVPWIDKDIKLIQNIITIFDDFEFIHHKIILEERIVQLKKQKEKELLSDYLE